MSTWQTVRLPDVAEIVMGQSPPGDTYNETGDGLPFFQGKTEFGEVSPTPKKWCNSPKKIAEAGDILISVRAPVGPTNLADTQCCIGRGLAAIRAKQDVLNPTYLRFALRHTEPHLASMGQGAIFPAIGRAELSATQFPLPPLPEQRHIVDLLSRAEGIVRLRREAEKKAAELIPALFLDMFGDPATNPKEWERTELGTLLDSIDSGQSPKCHSQQKQPDQWGVLKLSALSGGLYREEEHKTLPSEVSPDMTVEVRSGDVLLSRKNTYELVGTAAYVEKTIGRILLPDLIFRLNIINTERLNPMYLWGLLSMKSKREQIRNLASGSAGSMPNISKARLKTLKIELPPLQDQLRFSLSVEQVRSIQSQQSAATTKAQGAFDALLARYFATTKE